MHAYYFKFYVYNYYLVFHLINGFNSYRSSNRSGHGEDLIRSLESKTTLKPLFPFADYYQFSMSRKPSKLMLDGLPMLFSSSLIL